MKLNGPLISSETATEGGVPLWVTKGNPIPPVEEGSLGIVIRITDHQHITEGIQNIGDRLHAAMKNYRLPLSDLCKLQRVKSGQENPNASGKILCVVLLKNFGCRKVGCILTGLVSNKPQFMDQPRREGNSGPVGAPSLLQTQTLWRYRDTGKQAHKWPPRAFRCGCGSSAQQCPSGLWAQRYTESSAAQQVLKHSLAVEGAVSQLGALRRSVVGHEGRALTCSVDAAKSWGCTVCVQGWEVEGGCPLGGCWSHWLWMFAHGAEGTKNINCL
ncbi:uncharacterized protein [Struthio camelus]|uniref:uncharacterized protein isoform X2 n=1 Tax=Struthio camelus TaxID=8801 RepID=UPI003603AF31